MAKETENLKWYEKKAGMNKMQKQKAEEKKDIRRKRRAVERGEIPAAEEEGRPAKKTSRNSERKNSRPAQPVPSMENYSDEDYQRDYNEYKRMYITKKPLVVKDVDSLFDPRNIPQDARSIIASLDRIISSTHPLNSKQRTLLPQQIRALSHNLTDERSDRRMGYMNETTALSAYVHYYLWWNLVRLTKLFANLPDEFLKLSEQDICLDVGSGPLTLPIAMFLARPELRTQKLTWYCMDISSQALSVGENIFYSIAAKLECEPWKIVRVKGQLGTELKEKATFISCANAFNEIIEDADMPPDFLAKKYSDKILSYAERNRPGTRVLVVEPGTPNSARFTSLMRDSFIRKGYEPCSPCPHAAECPMHGRKGNKGKWCNFAFSTEDAPEELKKLSERSQLPKDRAVLSFFAGMIREQNAADVANDLDKKLSDFLGEQKELAFRVASDPIRLPIHRTGYYACSELGLLLVVTDNKLFSGQCLSTPMPSKELDVDEKSGAQILVLD